MDAPPPPPPTTQYARTPDAASIAYWSLGEGRPLVAVPGMPFPLQQAWQTEEMRAWYTSLAAARRLVGYDHRGFGLSERHVTDFSLSTCVGDLAAVADAAQLEQFDLFADYRGAFVALAYAQANPARVGRIALWCPVNRPTGLRGFRDSQALRHLADVDQDVYQEVMDLWLMGDVHRSFIDSFTDAINASDPDAHRAWRDSLFELDIDDLAPGTSHPVTVLHRADSQFLPLIAGQEVASLLPGARLRVFEGDSMAYAFQGADQIAAAVLDAVSDPNDAPASVASGSTAFRTILFTDIVASTPLLAQLKDAKMRDIMHDHDAVLNAAVEAHDGHVIKEMGDAFMVEFAAPSAAVACAVDMQRGIRDTFAESDVPIQLRIGINAGEPVVEDDDRYGLSVVIAKRLESAAPVNGILIADGLKQLLAGKDFDFTDQGDVTLKGLDEPLHAWTVRWD